MRNFLSRYVSSAICSFQASGGSIPGLLPQLPPDQRIQGAENLTGLLFEKFSVLDVDSAGRGGYVLSFYIPFVLGVNEFYSREYTVQAGFGWTNGVLLWTSSRFGDVLTSPSCPTLYNQNPSSNSTSGNSTSGNSTSAAHIAVPMNALTGVSVLVTSLLGALAVF
jgi:alpha,alpha-trehalase